MRELGLRAWSIKKHKFLNIDVLYCANGKVCAVVEDGVVYDIENVILEQDTGLKDKNGRKIYEGDILEFDKDFDDSTNRYVPYFDEKLAAFGFRIYGYQDYISESGSEEFESNMSFIGEMENYEREEIIFYTEYISRVGNIHENPELLEKLNEDC